MMQVIRHVASFAIIFVTLSAECLPAQVPATVEEAAKAIDLGKFPLLPGTSTNPARRLANLDYKARSDVRGAFAFQKKTLEEQGWKELAGGYLSDESCSGTFGKGGFTLTVSTIGASGPNSAGLVNIHIGNLGNVAVSKLPVPPGAKLLYSFPAATAYITEKSVKETSDVLRTLLTAQGWEPYGNAGDSMYFKKNAVKLSAFPSVAPAQGGKTMILFSAELMSVDLPAPQHFLSASYADATKALFVVVDMTPDALAAFYQEALGKAGWKSTTQKPVKLDFREMMIFRNDAKDIATLMMTKADGKLNANLAQQTAVEYAEAIRLAEIEAAQRKAKSAQYAKEAADKAARERVTIAITVPDDAKDVKQSKDLVEFKLATGKARAAVEAIQAALVKDGWTAKSPELEPIAGAISLEKKPGSTVVIFYVDTGLDDAQVTVSSFGADIQS
jgi:hypothetical protein